MLNWVYRINVDVAHVYTYDFDQVLYFYTYHYQTDKWRVFLPQFISKEIHDIVADGYEEH